MQTTRWGAVLGTLAAVAAPLAALAPAAWAQKSEGSAGKPPSATYDASWPVVLKPGPQRARSGPPPARWSHQDIELARARCAALLDGLDLVAEPAEPIRERTACGTPAPMRLVSIGSDPPVTFSPPATLTCDMIAGLYRWLQNDVQPLARRHLGAPIVKIKVMSSYSCRYSSSRARTRLSEHGRANALDFGVLLTAEGARPRVLADWGPVGRGRPARAATARKRGSKGASRAAAARAEAVKRRAEAVAAARKAKASTTRRVAAPAGVRTFQGTSIPMGFPSLSGDERGTATSLGWGPPSRLGGPKEEETAAASARSRRTFLHAIHKAACAIFSTVLGPEANRAHRNHFHLDMARRKSADICE